MDRDLSHQFPQMQIDFIDTICAPVYQASYPSYSTNHFGISRPCNMSVIECVSTVGHNPGERPFETTSRRLPSQPRLLGQHG